MKRTLQVCLVLVVMLAALETPESTANAKSMTSTPTLAVLPFNSNMDSQSIWWVGGEFGSLIKSNKFTVLSGAELERTLKARNLDWKSIHAGLPFVGTAKAQEFGEAIGVKFLLTVNVVVEVPVQGKDQNRTVSMKASLIDTSTGKVIWVEDTKMVHSGVSGVSGFGGGVDDVVARKLIKLCVKELATKLNDWTAPETKLSQ